MIDLLKWLRNYFGFNKTETYGVIVIHLVILTLIVSPIILEYTLKTEVIIQNLELVEDTTKIAFEKAPSKDSLFKFDPNSISKDELVKTGLQEYLAARLIKFRDKGGRFAKADDLLVIYGIDSGWVKNVSNYISIPKNTLEKTHPTRSRSSGKFPEKQPVNRTAASPIKLDINDADTAELRKIRGVGKVLSNRIVKFREMLGGFHTIKQIEEVYGLKPEVIDVIAKKFAVDKNFLPRQILINHCTQEELQSHPYFDKKLSELILNYRKNHFPLGPDDLKKIPALSDTLRIKIIPYLSFD